MYDAILVFGHLVKKDGSLSEEQILRLDKGIELLNKKKAKNIIMSGGIGEKNKTKKPLAHHMKEYAIKKKVPENRIFLENSLDTIGKIIFSKMLLNRKGWKSLIVVSSKYHVPRIKMICKFIMPKKYKLKFVGVKTPNDAKKAILKKEKTDFKRDKEWLKHNVIIPK